jgi:hypothetical protein
MLNLSCEPCGISALIWILGVLAPCTVLFGALSVGFAFQPHSIL